MPLFAQTAKYTAEALAAVRKDSFVSREAVLKKMVESAGGRPIAFYWPLSADADLIGIAEYPSSDVAYAIASNAIASGTVQRTQTTELRTAAEADAAIALQLTWAPPGQS